MTIEPSPSSSAAAGRWLERHTTSSAARALDTSERWVFVHASLWRRRKDQLVFPWPHELDDVCEAEVWAERAERLAADHAVNGTYATLLLGAMLGTAGGALVALAADFKLLLALVLLTGELAGLALFLELARQALAVSPAWERRAVALRRRADTLAATAPGPRRRRSRWCRWLS